MHRINLITIKNKIMKRFKEDALYDNVKINHKEIDKQKKQEQIKRERKLKEYKRYA